MHIRPAIPADIPADIPALCQLLDQLLAQEAEFTPDRAAQQRGLAAIIADPAVGEILVAVEDARIVAMVNLLYTISTALGARVALLEDMVVDAATRGAGVGSALLERAIAHAREIGCRRLTLLTDADNLAAQRFYGRQGFTHSAMRPLRRVL
ncbi:GNAT family N-acetyltransferase [Pseudomonas sp. MAP12]|uniref:GNAT family N-acetyltransferase n=1 Tax=Geopseudomonas aromaticivorans TaxID=2849492 RepID=A0ABS6MZU9_9GAMM|nr:GNAT family N-acetyltransferase [Pseudomonas aromaticivorans]MBV2134337.1 GNAT family N-acetyltransferase [Pseudomonas aromaticivorans]